MNGSEALELYIKLEETAELWHSSEEFRKTVRAACKPLEAALASLPLFQCEARTENERRVRAYVRSFCCGLTKPEILAEYRLELEQRGKTPRAGFLGEFYNNFEN